ncbi:MAG: HPF/RaiA family ribosome-associated protein [Bacteroidetes bacterium]|nr:HPF/RaiA family ribosome-associated protein [Bacteroidota bacterium]
MKIQINTDRNISGSEKMNSEMTELISDSLDRFSERITRIEVHLSDENSKKKGQNDIKCMIEARLKGKDPLAVSNRSDSLEHAVNGALDKLTSLLNTVVEKSKNY